MKNDLMKEVDIWVRKLENQLPGTRKLIEELQQERKDAKSK